MTERRFPPKKEWGWWALLWVLVAVRVITFYPIEFPYRYWLAYRQPVAIGFEEILAYAHQHFISKFSIVMLMQQLAVVKRQGLQGTVVMRAYPPLYPFGANRYLVQVIQDPVALIA